MFCLLPKQIVTIYRDYRTQTTPEGDAQLIGIVSCFEEKDSFFEIWKVKFLGENKETQRIIKVN